MHVAVYGTGGVGGYFGGKLAQAGEDVTFIARGAHRDAIRANGLRVDSIGGDFVIQPAKAESDPAAVGPVDVVIVGVKTWQVAESALAMRPLIGPDTLVVPLQNGVDAPYELADVLDTDSDGTPHVIGGLCRLVTMIVAPGHIRHAGVDPYIAFNRMDGQPDERVERLRAAFQRAGVNVEVPADITSALWAKLAFIAPLSGVGAVTRVTAGVLRSVPETRRVLEAAVREIEAVARARGVNLPADVTERTMATFDNLPEGGTSSMQRDIMDGRPSELEAQNGAVVRLGAAAGVPTPAHAFLYAALLPQEQKARAA